MVTVLIVLYVLGMVMAEGVIENVERFMGEREHIVTRVIAWVLWPAMAVWIICSFLWQVFKALKSPA